MEKEPESHFPTVLCTQASTKPDPQLRTQHGATPLSHFHFPKAPPWILQELPNLELATRLGRCAVIPGTPRLLLLLWQGEGSRQVGGGDGQKEEGERGMGERKRRRTRGGRKSQKQGSGEGRKQRWGDERAALQSFWWMLLLILMFK